jgi:hypothetical protein
MRLSWSASGETTLLPDPCSLTNNLHHEVEFTVGYWQVVKIFSAQDYRTHLCYTV